MKATVAVELIERKDWTFTEKPFSIDPSAADDLLVLMKSEDPEVRELALLVLNRIDGSHQRRQAILQGLTDDDVNVRSAACQYLLTDPDQQDLKALYTIVRTHHDEFVREYVALALGKIGDRHTKTFLLETIAKESDANAKHAMHLALVRLNDRENRKRYAAEFQDPDPKRRTRALQDFRYVENRAFIPDILPLLDDQQNGLNVGPSRKKINIRVCDVAINVLDEVLDHPFSFEIGEKKKYSRDERNAAKALLRKE